MNASEARRGRPPKALEKGSERLCNSINLSPACPPGRAPSSRFRVRESPVRHSYADLADDVARARANLIRWNVKAGMRVGIFAPNSYAYIVYDLALVDLRRHFRGLHR